MPRLRGPHGELDRGGRHERVRALPSTTHNHAINSRFRTRALARPLEPEVFEPGPKRSPPPSRKAKGAASNGRGPPRQEPIAKRLSWPSWPIALYEDRTLCWVGPPSGWGKTCNS